MWPPRSPYIGHSIDKAPNDRHERVISITVRRIPPRARLEQGSVMSKAQLSEHDVVSNDIGISEGSVKAISLVFQHHKL